MRTVLAAVAVLVVLGVIAAVYLSAPRPTGGGQSSSSSSSTTTSLVSSQLSTSTGGSASSVESSVTGPSSTGSPASSVESTTSGTAPVSSQSSSPSGTGSQPCLFEVPSGSTINAVQNSTFVGYVVAFQNGTKGSYPLDRCPVPVTSAVYATVVRIESAPTFIAAANGSQFEYDPTDQVVKSNSSGSFQTFSFAAYSDQKFYSCGAGSQWTYYQLGQIIVTARLPVNPNGTLQIQIHAIPKAELNMPSCGEISAPQSVAG